MVRPIVAYAPGPVLARDLPAGLAACEEVLFLVAEQAVGTLPARLLQSSGRHRRRTGR